MPCLENLTDFVNRPISQRFNFGFFGTHLYKFYGYFHTKQIRAN